MWWDRFCYFGIGTGSRGTDHFSRHGADRQTSGSLFQILRTRYPIDDSRQSDQLLYRYGSFGQWTKSGFCLFGRCTGRDFTASFEHGGFVTEKHRPIANNKRPTPFSGVGLLSSLF